jgi:hypothetical protein
MCDVLFIQHRPLLCLSLNGLDRLRPLPPARSLPAALADLSTPRLLAPRLRPATHILFFILYARRVVTHHHSQPPLIILPSSISCGGMRQASTTHLAAALLQGAAGGERTSPGAAALRQREDGRDASAARAGPAGAARRADRRLTGGGAGAGAASSPASRHTATQEHTHSRHRSSRGTESNTQPVRFSGARARQGAVSGGFACRPLPPLSRLPVSLSPRRACARRSGGRTRASRPSELRSYLDAERCVEAAGGVLTVRTPPPRRAQADKRGGGGGGGGGGTHAQLVDAAPPPLAGVRGAHRRRHLNGDALIHPPPCHRGAGRDSEGTDAGR